MKGNQEFISAQYDALLIDHKSLLETKAQQEKEIKKLKNQSVEFETRGIKEEEKLDALEQYGRRLNLEIAGVPVRNNENTNDLRNTINMGRK